MAKESKKEQELTVEQKLKTLYQLQSMLSKIDEIKTLRGELPLEVGDLEDEVEGLSTRIEGIKAEIGAEKKEFPLQLPSEDVKAAVREYALEKGQWMFDTFERSERNAREAEVKADVQCLKA